MNRDFLSNFEQPKNQPEVAESGDIEWVSNVEVTDYRHGESGHNVCFVWPDGRRKFMEYSRLDSGEINPDNDIVRLMFGTETVELTGIGLLPLFKSLMAHGRKFVYCDDARYNSLSNDEPIVNEIIISTAQ